MDLSLKNIPQLLSLNNSLLSVGNNDDIFEKSFQNYLIRAQICADIFYPSFLKISSKVCFFSLIGSLCKSFSTRSYQLPVMDSIFVRKSQRGKGFGLQMLEDFVLSFKEECLGLRYPLTTSMYKGT